jgi:hypothetical protein
MRVEAKTLSFAAAICLLLGLGVVQERRLSNSANSAPVCELYFKTEALCASLEWVKKPAAPSDAAFRLKFWNTKTGSPQGPFVAPPGEVRISLWMPGMGHGADPVTTTHDANETGVVQVNHASFSMKGDWEIWVSLLSGDRFIEKARTTYRL